jgi:hypothetical protein
MKPDMFVIVRNFCLAFSPFLIVQFYLPLVRDTYAWWGIGVLLSGVLFATTIAFCDYLDSRGMSDIAVSPACAGFLLWVIMLQPETTAIPGGEWSMRFLAMSPFLLFFGNGVHRLWRSPRVRSIVRAQ